MQTLIRRNASKIARQVARRSAAPASARSMASGKDIVFGNEARAKMLVGVDRLAEAVKVTLGPKVSIDLINPRDMPPADASRQMPTVKPHIGMSAL
jgi:hypothetical protein